jgi:hypothetical protein
VQAAQAAVQFLVLLVVELEVLELLEQAAMAVLLFLQIIHQELQLVEALELDTVEAVVAVEAHSMTAERQGLV